MAEASIFHDVKCVIVTSNAKDILHSSQFQITMLRKSVNIREKFLMTISLYLINCGQW